MTAISSTMEMLKMDFISGFPKEAAEMLERMPSEEISELLTNLNDQETIDLWEQLSPDVAMRAILQLPEDRLSRHPFFQNLHRKIGALPRFL